MFNPGRNQPTISFPLSYNTIEATNIGVWASKTANCHSGNHVGVQFGTESKVEDESGICSPPLWTSTQPRSPQHIRNHYRNLSPSSKTQAIERGQRELMEMVQNMPESCYELSLKDLVERPRVDQSEEHRIGEKNLRNKNVHRKREVKRSGKIDSGGLYLKMVFPSSLGSKKNTKKNEKSNSSKVSPRPSVSDGSIKGLDKEWWKKSSINSGSLKSSGSSSTNSSRSNSRHEISAGSCWPFFRRSEILAED